MMIPRKLPASLVLLAMPFLFVQQSVAWGNDGHRIINRLAAQFLPSDTPAFLRNGEGLDTMEYLGPEPDRWRSRAENELSQTQAPDHFIDMECADMAGTLPKNRYDYFRAIERVQTAHPELKLTPERVGFQPWQVQEVYQRLKADFREYRKLLATNADTRPDEKAILFDAGWLGHYVADGSQPLHTSIYYNGWTGTNPKGYSNDHKIHGKFESDYVRANISRDEIAGLVSAARPTVIADEWNDYLAYLRRSNSMVEKTYQLDKAGAFDGVGTPEGKAFTDERMAAGVIKLRDLMYTAWVRSADPVPDHD